MSDKESNKEHDQTATNRLLDLLRSQQAGDPADEQEKAEPKPAPAKQAEPDSPPEKPEPAPSSKKTKPKSVESDSTETAKKQPQAGAQKQDLMAKFRTSMKVRTSSATDEKSAAPSKESDVAITDAETKDPGIDQKKPDTKDLLQDLKPSASDAEPEVEVEPEVFDESLFSVFSGQTGAPPWKQYLDSLYHVFNGSTSFLTVKTSEKTLILMRFSLTPTGMRVDDYSIFTLPYKDGENSIKTMEELVPRSLDLFLEKKPEEKPEDEPVSLKSIKDLLPWVLKRFKVNRPQKNYFVAYCSSIIKTNTLVIQTPQLKGKELEELIKWNLKKKHSVDPKKTLIQWEVLAGTPSTGKQNVVVVTVPVEEVSPALRIFNEKKLPVRYHSALPVLLWKSFIRNYPDRNKGCHVLVHLGETTTDVMFIVDHQLLFSRDISLGIEDLYSAIMQKVVVGDSTVKIDYATARKIIGDYGIPITGKGVLPDSGISLYKLSIYLRPVIERLTNELNRSLKYFNKQYPDLEWEELILDGPGAVVPNLLTTLHNNLNVPVSLFNPKRTVPLQTAPDVDIPADHLPATNLNFAMASGNARSMNLLPSNLLLDNKFAFLNKLSMAAAILFIPLFIGSGFMKYQDLGQIKKEVHGYNEKWTELTSETRDYYDISNDCDILDNYPRYLKNDEIYSQNQIQLMKIFSSIVSQDIKFTSMVFSREVKPAGESSGVSNKLGDILDIKGFIQSDAAVADIRMTNFVIKLEEMDMFTKVTFKMDENSRPRDGKLFFKINLKLKT